MKYNKFEKILDFLEDNYDKWLLSNKNEFFRMSFDYRKDILEESWEEAIIFLAGGLDEEEIFEISEMKNDFIQCLNDRI